jgi:hypothetical protein
MNKVRFLKKIALAASVMLAMTFTLGCSDDEKEEAKAKWCSWTVPSMPAWDMCGEFGKGPKDDSSKKYFAGDKLAESDCKDYSPTYTAEKVDAKPEKCIVITE